MPSLILLGQPSLCQTHFLDLAKISVRAQMKPIVSAWVVLIILPIRQPWDWYTTH